MKNPDKRAFVFLAIFLLGFIPTWYQMDIMKVKQLNTFGWLTMALAFIGIGGLFFELFKKMRSNRKS